MKRLFFLPALLAISTLACNLGASQPTAATAEPAGTQPAVSVTEQVTQSAGGNPSQGPGSQPGGQGQGGGGQPGGGQGQGGGGPQGVSLTPSLSDVTYCTMDGVELKMDVYYPETQPPWPVTMYVHGGGWTKGDKADGAGAVEIPSLQQAGFLVVAVNYRLAPEYPFPAMIQDIKCAVRYLRAHASEYNLDPDHIGVWGGSAGGHLVSLMGVTDESAGFDVGEYLEYSSRVQAVVSMFGPTDLTVDFEGNPTSKADSVVFGEFDPALASPVTYATADDPPYLFLHGEKDSLVPIEQSEILLAALQAVGVQAELVPVVNANHSFKPDGGQISPSRREIAQSVVSFFEEWLK